MKRLFDIAVASILLVLLSPLLALIAVLVAIDSRGGAIFRQQRVGRDGKVFEMYKFRSMVVDAAAQGPWYTSPGDARVTRVGRFLRKTSLDELPQLVNVLRGDLSLVGPRPDVPAQKSLYTEEEWKERHSVRPGITGPAQAWARGVGSVEQRKQLDLAYARKHGFRTDCLILLATIRQVLFTGSH
jgi:lipopolysaccharide/colanic/teichoic acid biosynthesis glycosyltransferase